MVRAIGPSLPLEGVLANPTLELHDSAGSLITSSDNWMEAPNLQEIIDSTIAPTNDLESAILLSLDPGLYTAIVRGVNDTTGIGLVEVYDLHIADPWRSQPGFGASPGPPQRRSAPGSAAVDWFDRPGGGKPHSPAPSFAVCGRDVLRPSDDARAVGVLHRRAALFPRAQHRPRRLRRSVTLC
jgi:hypothetical protein